ncbi:MAG: hypothetical protein Q8L48_09665 [Archangium sp.]|nr:hypothetical protein [Archangium sp.]
MAVEVGTHEEALPEDAEAMQPTRRIRFRTGPLVDAQAALALLTTPQRLPRLHPLITRVEELPVRVEGTVRIADFTVHEGVPLLGGLVKWPNSYRGRVALDASKPGTARLSGWSAPGVRVETRYVVLDGVLEETAWISAPWWVDPFVYRTFVEAHRRLLEAVAVTPA